MINIEKYYIIYKLLERVKKINKRWYDIMKVSKIKEMKNYQTFEDEEVKLNTTIVSEKSSRLDKVAEIFFKHDKIIYRFIDLSILIGLFVLIASILKQNNNAVILIGLMEIILGVMRYKIGILGYWHLNKDLPIFEKKRFGNDRTNLVWYNVFPKTKEVEKPTNIQKEAFDCLRRINNQVNKAVFSFYSFCMAIMFVIFAIVATIIVRNASSVVGVIAFFVIVLFGLLCFKSIQNNISSRAKDNFNIELTAFDKGDRVMVKARFQLEKEDLYQIELEIKTKNAPQVIKVLQDFT